MVIRAQVFYLAAPILQNSESAEIMGELNARSGALSGRIYVFCHTQG
jgi:hypothetical protein